ncbi:MAG: ABC transporter ATP-binding protein, partial [Planctomycetes bacterium]|nr:ABC transporter ATP-binding protein [Planctomycetota bacterium]
MIRVENLVKRFGRTVAVDDVSFEVAEGEVVGFLGPNGAGKTTTIRVLTCYHPATSGRASVAGHDVFRDSVAVRRNIGYLPENVPIYPDMRVTEYLSYRAALKGVPRRERRSKVEAAMERCGVVEVRRKLIGHVSRGYRQRVGLADALVARPKILVLDEPTSGLDPNQRRRMKALIRELSEEHTILFSSHILAEVEDVSDRIVIISDGRKRADGTIDELMRAAPGRALVVEARAAAEAIEAIVTSAISALVLTGVEPLGDWSRVEFGVPVGADPREEVAR